MFQITAKLVIFICFASLSAFSQTDSIVSKLETNYQTCLDRGQYMLGCSENFYLEMDSLLTVSYNRLSSSCDSLQKDKLGKEQQIRLKKRNKQFIQNRKQTEIEATKLGYNGGEIEQMDRIDKNAMFIKNRIIILGSKKPIDYSPTIIKPIHQ